MMFDPTRPSVAQARQPLVHGIALFAFFGFAILPRATSQSGCVATFEKDLILWCQGQVTHSTFARLDPNCGPFSTNGTFSEARRSTNASGMVLLSTQGFVRAPAQDSSVYASSSQATASGDVRYFGPPANLTLTLQVFGQAQRAGTVTSGGAFVKCGPDPEVGYTLPYTGSLNTTLTKTFAVTNGSSFDLSCRAKYATSGWSSTTGRWVGWSFEVTLANASINLGGQAFTLSSTSLPIVYWPPAAPASVTPFGQACANGGGAPTTTAVGLPVVGNSAFGIEVTVPVSSIALLSIGISPVAPVNLGNGCLLLTSNDLLLIQPSVNGSALFSFPIPAAASFLGATFDVQGGNVDLGTSALSTSAGLRIVIGY